MIAVRRVWAALAPATLMLVVTTSALFGQSFAKADAAVRAGIDRGIYPGAVLVIGTADRVLHARGFGRMTWARRARSVTPDSTLFDLASLTKVVATTLAAALLVDRGDLDLDARVDRYLPRFRGPGKEAVTVRMLLDHTSGEPAWVPFFRLAPTRDSALSLLYATPLARRAGGSPVYSDLNAMLLGLIVAQVSGTSLDRFVSREIFTPLEMTRTVFNPPVPWRGWIAPTGRYRGRPVAGTVNDQNAARLGGVAGHAGLFSTGADLARYAQFWLRRGVTGAGTRLLADSTIRRFLRPSGASGHRLLGWERPDPDEYHPDPYGSLLSAEAYGHTGWTGTQIWLDPARGVFVVFLTNRSYDPRVRRPFTALHEIRGRLADAVAREFPVVAAGAHP